MSNVFSFKANIVLESLLIIIFLPMMNRLNVRFSSNEKPKNDFTEQKGALEVQKHAPKPPCIFTSHRHMAIAEAWEAEDFKYTALFTLLVENQPKQLIVVITLALYFIFMMWNDYASGTINPKPKVSGLCSKVAKSILIQMQIRSLFTPIFIACHTPEDQQVDLEPNLSPDNHKSDPISGWS